ncbi:MAG: hypothetical protein DCF24_07415 [Cyanobium sp.]|nr:MAG: hypothetical protein DCF24_07415 [Cyanobium sp.]PZV01337.1 MAG: hypothetical protein DCF23_13415 [Cyanobium sp.]
MSFTTPPEPSTPCSAPSFVIRGAGGQGVSPLRWDQINSGDVLRRARQIYFHYVEQCPAGGAPIGIVLQGHSSQGRVVFDTPVLLPEEQFIPLDLIRSRGGRPRGFRSP